MTEPSHDVTQQLAEMDARIRELEAVQQLILRILATTKPLDSVLEQYGATLTQQREFYALLDELVSRARGRERDHPTFAYFEMKVADIFPALRHDREFRQLLIDTLGVERAAYRELHAYASTHGWTGRG